MALVVIAEEKPDFGDRGLGVKKILGGEFHAAIEEALENSGAEFLFKGRLQCAFVGAHHGGQLV